MFCSNCGREIDNRAAVCIHCGALVGRFYPKPEDAPSGGFAAIGFFIPLVGLILYLVYHDTRPLRAKSAGKGALIGFVVNILISVALVALSVALPIIISTRDIRNGVIDGKPAYSGDLAEDKTKNILENSLDVFIGDFVIEKGDYFDETKLNVTVRNKGESRRSFFIKIEAVDKTGARLDTDMIYATDLNSGQEIHLEAFKYVAQDKIQELKSATFKVLEVLMY